MKILNPLKKNMNVSGVLAMKESLKPNGTGVEPKFDHGLINRYIIVFGNWSVHGKDLGGFSAYLFYIFSGIKKTIR